MNFLKDSLSFKSEILHWLLFKKNAIKDSTYYRYTYVIEKYILPYFENKSIYYFVNYDFNIYVENLAKFLQTKTIKDILVVFKSILKFIGRRHNIDYKIDLISIPKCEKDEMKILSEDEKNTLENYCKQSNNLRDIGILICLNTGLRLGEICALTWSNINLKENYISINRTLQRIYKKKTSTSIEISSPKTKNSVRKIPISTKLHKQLAELKKANKYSGEEYFLTGCKEKYMDPRTYQRAFKRCLKVCHLRNYNFHILRHTFASNCVKIGMDIKSLSEVLGHADVRTTLSLYIHPSYSNQKKFLDRL